MHKLVGGILIAVIAVAVSSSTASGSLIETDDPTFGIGAITIDTATGSRWLDVSFSQGLSYNQVSEQLGVGGTFAGFRFATSTEVQQLFENAGISATDGVYRDEDFEPASSLLDRIGATESGPLGRAVQAITGDALTPDSHAIFQVAVKFPPFPNGSRGYAIGLDASFVEAALNSDVSLSRGSWLVKAEAAPEPSSFVLGGVAVAGWLIAKRRRAITS
jgi:hypothetical protein